MISEPWQGAGEGSCKSHDCVSKHLTPSAFPMPFSHLSSLGLPVPYAVPLAEFPF